MIFFSNLSFGYFIKNPLYAYYLTRIIIQLHQSNNYNAYFIIGHPGQGREAIQDTIVGHQFQKVQQHRLFHRDEIFDNQTFQP